MRFCLSVGRSILLICGDRLPELIELDLVGVAAAEMTESSSATLNINNMPSANINNNSNNIAIPSSTTSPLPPTQQQSPHHAHQQYGRVDLSPSMSNHGEMGGGGGGGAQTTAPVAAPKRELNIRSWFSSSSMASSSSPPVTGDLLNIEGSPSSSSREQQQQQQHLQQRPISPPSGMTPPAPSKDSIFYLPSLSLSLSY